MRRRAFLGLAVVVACRKTEAIAVDKKATRIVSISPSTTEAVDAIGARALLVGRSRYCDYPPEIRSLPEIGGYIDPNIEAILALRPDLVVGARGPSGPSITDTLATRGIATYFPRTESFAEIDAMILGIGERCDRASAAAECVATMHGDEAKLATSLEGKPKPRVLFVFGITPIVAAGPASFADEMLSRAHATNAVSDGAGYPTLGIERVLSLDPDVIVEAAWGERGSQAITKDAAGWGRLRAVREGRVQHIADESILRPGPRVVHGVEKLARAIHP